MKTHSPQEAAKRVTIYENVPMTQRGGTEMEVPKKVRELPILFAPDLAQKVYLGIKTETRRPMKNVPEWITRFGFTAFTPKGSISGRGTYEDQGPGEKFFKLPYQPGDVLYVREAHAIVPERGFPYLRFRGADELADLNVKWEPSTHLPKLSARTWLEVLSVSVEKVSEITREGARAEGYPVHDWNAKGVLHMEDRSLFREAWNARYPGTWEANAWVWVIKFKKVEAPNGRA